MTAVVVNIMGDKQFMFRTRALAAAVVDSEPILEVVADDILRVIGATFNSQGRRYGGSWHALDKDTIREKTAKHQDPRILIATGKLKKAYSVRGAPHQHLKVTRSEITLDSTLPYAVYHQEGRGHNPKREFIKFYPQDHARWTKMVGDGLMRAFEGGGRRA
jgi:hypothetical protein